MEQTRLLLLLLACPIAAHLVATGVQDAHGTPTRIIHYTPPTALPERARTGSCSTSSVASYRTDAFACLVDKTAFDPCFTTTRQGHVLCGADPRLSSSGTLVAAALPPAAPSAATPAHARHHTWFFELADGSTCQPLSKPGQVFDGAVELYGCRFGSAGEADALLGDLDDSAPVWTIQKVLINKKVEPQTIKSLMIAAVKTVWE